MTTAERACPACHTPLPEAAQFCMHCGRATPTDPGVPPRMMPTGEFEVAKVRRVLGTRYRIDRVVGEGGMATVYLAEDLKHKRQVAVKVMRPELAATLGSDRFLREVEIAAQLSHPHILPMYDSGEADGVLYYVMPFVEGESLAARMKREQQMSVGEALRLAREVAEALAYAHKRGIVHRDIKPANILLHEGHALVADFGIARALGADSEAITRTGLAVGTPQYMSPEQATGAREIDGRTDVYALGAVLYEMLAGEPPFTGPTAQSIIARSLTEDPRPVENSRPGLSPEVGRTIHKALARGAADRYDTAELFAAALEKSDMAWRSGAHTPAAELTAATPPRTGFRRFLTPRNGAIAAGVALLLWAVTATVMARRPDGAAAANGAMKRVAVLPFENLGSEADAYFADGIVDEVRGKLSRVSGLTVIASTSTEQYRGTSKSAQEIAGELGVDYLLVGRVRWAGTEGAKRVQVVPEVIDGRTGGVTWQQTFDADVNDVFEVQSQIASRVAGALGSALGRTETEELTDRPTSNLVAWDLYLKAKGIVDPAAPSQRQASAYLEQAVALDSTFDEAWSLLSITQGRVYGNGNRDPASANRAREALERARAIAPNSATTNAAATRYYMTVERDGPRARQAAEDAVAAAPNNADILAMAAQVDFRVGDTKAGLEKLTHAREVDPRSSSTLSSLQQAFVYSRRFQEALEISDQLVRMEPTDPNAVQWQVIANIGRGDLAGARMAIRNGIQRGIPSPTMAAYLAGFLEMGWVLEEKDRELLFRLTPTAFDDDRAWWGQALSSAHWDGGSRVLARAYADSALATSRAQSQANPDESQLHSLYGMVLAYAGEREAAITEGERGLALTPDPNGAEAAYELQTLLRINLALGNVDRSLELAERLLQLPWHTNSAWMRLDPMYEPLRGDPRFEKLLVEAESR